MSDLIDDDLGSSCNRYSKGCQDNDEELCIDGQLLGGPERSIDYGPCLCPCHGGGDDKRGQQQ